MTSQIAPRSFWMTLLTDALPLLEQKQVQVEPMMLSSLHFVVLNRASFCSWYRCVGIRPLLGGAPHSAHSGNLMSTQGNFHLERGSCSLTIPSLGPGESRGALPSQDGMYKAHSTSPPSQGLAGKALSEPGPQAQTSVGLGWGQLSKTAALPTR